MLLRDDTMRFGSIEEKEEMEEKLGFGSLESLQIICIRAVVRLLIKPS